MPEMRCAGCMEAGSVVFMDSVLCGECFFRQTVVAKAVRGSFESAVGRPPLPIASAQTAEAGDLVAQVITRLQRDLSDLLSALTPVDSEVAIQDAASQPRERRSRARRLADRVRIDPASAASQGDGDAASAAS